MNEEEVVRLFLKNGFQVSKSALNLVSEDPEAMISNLKKINPRPFIITEQHIKRVLKNTPNKSINVGVIKKHDFSKTPVHVSDYVKELSLRYEKIKLLLLKQIRPKKLVSINKITPRTTTFSIIGLVRKKNDESVLVEDPTGEISLYFDKEMEKELKSILLDDVVAAQCQKKRERCYVKKVFLLTPNHEIFV